MINFKNTHIYVILVCSFFTSFLVSVFINHPIIGDAYQYFILAENLFKYGIFSLSESRPIEPTMFREPLYPFFINLIYLIFGKSILPIYVIQCILFSLICVLTYCVGLIFFNKKIAFTAGLILSFLPPLFEYPGYILTETLFTFLLLSLFLLFYYLIKLNSNIIPLFLGLLLGMLALLKTSSFFLFFFISIFLILYSLKSKYYIISFKKILIIFLFYIITISPWMIRNYNFFDTLQIRHGGGGNIWMASQSIEYTQKDILKNVVFNFSEYLGGKIYSEENENKEYFLFNKQNLVFERERFLRNKGYTDTEINNYLTKEAIQIIIKNPVKFFLTRFLELQKMLAFTYSPTLNQPTVVEYFKEKSNEYILSLIKSPFRIVSYFIFLISFYSFINLKFSFEKYLIFSFIFYFNFIHSMLFGIGRYSVPIIPFYVVLFSPFVFLIITKLRNKFYDR